MTGGELGPTACPWRALLHSLRLRQWLKNAFVFAPAVFGLQFADPLALMHVLGAFFAFSLAASGTYLINDVVDREADRANPRTQHRPIARGEVQPATALVTACVLSAAGMALAWLAQALLPLVLYILASHAYSLIFKRVVVLDVVCLASLYVLRLLAGAAAAEVPPSPWLLACGGLLALLLALGKRMERANGHYPPWLLRRLLQGLLVVTAMAYAAYSLQPHTWKTFSHWFFLTNLPVVFGLGRYHQLATSGCPDPSDALFRDRPLQGAVLLWVILVLGLASRALV